jgi:hypothetical protein
MRWLSSTLFILVTTLFAIIVVSVFLISDNTAVADCASDLSETGYYAGVLERAQRQWQGELAAARRIIDAQRNELKTRDDRIKALEDAAKKDGKPEPPKPETK